MRLKTWELSSLAALWRLTSPLRDRRFQRIKRQSIERVLQWKTKQLQRDKNHHCLDSAQLGSCCNARNMKVGKASCEMKLFVNFVSCLNRYVVTQSFFCFYHISTKTSLVSMLWKTYVNMKQEEDAT